MTLTCEDKTTPTAAWTSAIDAWIVELQAGGAPRSTVYLRRYHLTRLAAEIDVDSPWSIGREDLVAWLGSHPDWSKEYRRSWRSSLRSFFAWGQETGQIDDDPARKLPKVNVPPPCPSPAPPEAAQSAIHESSDQVRLMIWLACELGMRRAEVAQVHSRDIGRDSDGWTLHIHGKGSRERVVPITNSLARTLRECDEGFIFPGQHNGHLSPAWVGKLVSRMLPRGVTMHKLRHLCASQLYEATKDLMGIKELLGHASVATTQRYIAVPPSAIRNMVTERADRWSRGDIR